MLKNEERHIASTCLIVLLFVVSFFKDDFSPDYFNTPDAEFIGTVPSRLRSLFQFPGFWLCAFAYSMVFLIIPYRIFLFSSNRTFANVVLVTLTGVIVLEYVLIFCNVPLLDKAIIPKINRLYHSPIFTLFTLAAFTINTRLKDA
jgi:hypothetical protein